jgi:hypothetical protein
MSIENLFESIRKLTDYELIVLFDQIEEDRKMLIFSCLRGDVEIFTDWGDTEVLRLAYEQWDNGRMREYLREQLISAEADFFADL